MNVGKSKTVQLKKFLLEQFSFQATLESKINCREYNVKLIVIQHLSAIPFLNII